MTTTNEPENTDGVRVIIPITFAQIYRALVGIEPIERASARAFMLSLAESVHSTRGMRIERICAQIDADTPSTPASATPPMDHLNSDGSVTRISNGVAVRYESRLGGDPDRWMAAIDERMREVARRAEVAPSIQSAAAQAIENLERAHEMELGGVTLERDQVIEELRILNEKHSKLVDEIRRIDAINHDPYGSSGGDPSEGAIMLRDALTWA